MFILFQAISVASFVTVATANQEIFRGRNRGI